MTLPKGLHYLCRDCFVGCYGAVTPGVLRNDFALAGACTCCGQQSERGVGVDQLSRDLVRDKYSRVGPGAPSADQKILELGA